MYRIYQKWLPHFWITGKVTWENTIMYQFWTAVPHPTNETCVTVLGIYTNTVNHTDSTFSYILHSFLHVSFIRNSSGKSTALKTFIHFWITGKVTWENTIMYQFWTAVPHPTNETCVTVLGIHTITVNHTDSTFSHILHSFLHVSFIRNSSGKCTALKTFIHFWITGKITWENTIMYQFWTAVPHPTNETCVTVLGIYTITVNHTDSTFSYILHSFLHVSFIRNSSGKCTALKTFIYFHALKFPVRPIFV